MADNDLPTWECPVCDEKWGVTPGTDELNPRFQAHDRAHFNKGKSVGPVSCEASGKLYDDARAIQIDRDGGIKRP